MRTLVLNQNYRPIGTISWQKAITLFFSNKVEIIEEYDRDIRSTSISLKMPAVVRILRWVRSKAVAVRFNKTNVYIRDKGRCQYCNHKISHSKATYDHVTPRARGGKTDWTNIVTCCYNCNQKKNCMTPHEAGMMLVTVPVKPEALPMELTFNLKYRTDFPEVWKSWLVSIQAEE